MAATRRVASPIFCSAYDGHRRFAFVPLVARRISKAISPRSKDSGWRVALRRLGKAEYIMKLTGC
jgi:hypothetical protein